MIVSGIDMFANEHL